jgi:hypothetical protein
MTRVDFEIDMFDYSRDGTEANGERVLIGDQLKQQGLSREGVNQSFLREAEQFLEKTKSTKGRNRKKDSDKS